MWATPYQHHLGSAKCFHQSVRLIITTRGFGVNRQKQTGEQLTFPRMLELEISDGKQGGEVNQMMKVFTSRCKLRIHVIFRVSS